MKLVNNDGSESIDLAALEPYAYSVVDAYGKLHPVLRVTYWAHHIEIEWSKEDKETLLKKMRNYDE